MYLHKLKFIVQYIILHACIIVYAFMHYIFFHSRTRSRSSSAERNHLPPLPSPLPSRRINISKKEDFVSLVLFLYSTLLPLVRQKQVKRIIRCSTVACVVFLNILLQLVVRVACLPVHRLMMRYCCQEINTVTSQNKI